jgi:hypothetical protein
LARLLARFILQQAAQLRTFASALGLTGGLEVLSVEEYPAVLHSRGAAAAIRQLTSLYREWRQTEHPEGAPYIPYAPGAYAHKMSTAFVPPAAAPPAAAPPAAAAAPPPVAPPGAGAGDAAYAGVAAFADEAAEEEQHVPAAAAGGHLAAAAGRGKRNRDEEEDLPPGGQAKARTRRH